MKIFNRSVKLGGEVRTINSVSVRVLEYDNDGKVLRCSGVTVPSGAGYAKGCIFIKTDAATGTKAIYENQGTTASSSFNLMGDITSTEISFSDAQFIKDNSGNELLTFGVTASAVNQLKLSNAATGGMPTFAAEGGDANISIKLTPKGTGRVVLGGYGGISTSTAAGAAIDIDGSYDKGEAVELRYTISNWTLGNQFNGVYLRVQSDLDNASGGLRGMEVLAVANASGLSDLKGLFAQAYVKGDTTDTVDTMYGLHAEISWDASRANTNTITTEATPLLAKVLSGKVDAYTKLHGAIVRFGDMDGGSRKYGSGVRFVDGPEAGTSSLTNVLYTDLAADYFLEVSAADKGAVDDTIAGQVVGTINAVVKCKFGSTDFFLYGYATAPSA